MSIDEKLVPKGEDEDWSEIAHVPVIKIDEKVI